MGYVFCKLSITAGATYHFEPSMCVIYSLLYKTLLRVSQKEYPVFAKANMDF